MTDPEHSQENDRNNNKSEAIDDENDDYDYEFMKSLFGGNNSDDDDNDEDEQVTEYSWSCQDTKVIYHLAFLAPGHGDAVWNSSDCIAQHLLLPEYRAKLLGGSTSRLLESWPPISALEFGAGAALPSMILFKAGTKRLLSTDQKINEETFDALHLSFQKNGQQWGISKEQIQDRIRVLPHSWGEDMDKLREAAVIDGDSSNDETGNIELLVASDCIYDPTYHRALLESVAGTMSRTTGRFVVGYSFHLNVPPAKVVEFFALAEKEFDFRVTSEFKQEYNGQEGIGNHDPNRGAVYIKVLAHKESDFFS